MSSETKYISDIPHLLEEWNNKRNESLSPHDISYGSGKLVWWKCAKCGHEWQATPNSRTSSYNSGCPECGKIKSKITAEKNKLKNTGSLIQTHPELLKEWDYNLNEITPDSISWHYSKKVYWVCRKGHVFCSAPNRRARLGFGCPTCAKEGGTSFPEQSIYYYLDSVIPTENRYIYKGVEIDIYIPSLKLGIEYDGKYYHNSKKSCIKETKKDNFLKGEGVRLIRIKECDDCRVVKNIIYTIPTKKT